MLNKILFFFILVLFVPFCCNPVRAAEKLSAASCQDNLVSIYKDAQASDPMLARARAALETARTEKPLARSRLLPRLTANGEISRRYNKLEGIAPDKLVTYYWGGDYTVSLVQPVFDGQAWVSLKIAEDILDAGEAELMSVRQALVMRTFEKYFNYLHARADQGVAEKQCELLQAVLRQAESFLKVGTGDITSVKEAKARFDAARAFLVRARNRTSVAKRELELLVHREVGGVADIENINPMLPQPDDMGKWVDAALSNQPVLLQARSMLEAANRRVEYERRRRWPRFDLHASGGYVNGGYFPEMRTTHTEAGLMVTFPLYLGGSIFAQTAKAQSQAVESRQHLEELKDQVTIEAQRAFLNLHDSVADYRAAKQALDSAKISMEATQKGYKVGTRTAIDALDLTQFYIEKQRDYLLTLYNHIIARARLKTAAGVIGEEDIIAANRMLTQKNGQQ